VAAKGTDFLSMMQKFVGCQ